VAFAGSVKRLIDRAYCTIADRRINEFDQVRINTFVPRPPKAIHLLALPPGVAAPDLFRLPDQPPLTSRSSSSTS
jgi:hypothetical protein